MGVGLQALGSRAGQIAAGALCVLACVLDLYTTQFILMPYHAGVSRENSGRLRQGAGIQVIWQALALNEGGDITPAIIAASWSAYLVATLFLIALAVALCSRVNPKSTAGRSDAQTLT